MFGLIIISKNKLLAQKQAVFMEGFERGSHVGRLEICAEVLSSMTPKDPDILSQAEQILKRLA